MSVQETAAAESDQVIEPDGGLATEAATEQVRPGSLAHDVLQKLKALPFDKQQEVLDFVEFLERKSLPKQPRRSLRGLWADLDIHITEEDIAEARREMWGNFPRDDI